MEKEDLLYVWNKWREHNYNKLIFESKHVQEVKICQFIKNIVPKAICTA